MDAETADGIEGAGILHVQSGTCALDIDNIKLARPWLAERGVDVDALLADTKAVQISSGRPGRAKLLYRLKQPLRTLKPTDSGIELRCANLQGRSVHDALPPTVHPDTHRPYVWKYGEPLLGDWGILPAIPASLKALWRQLINEAGEVAPVRKTNGHVDVALAKLQAWLEPQDPNSDYETWVKVGMKLHDATGGAEEGLDLWDQWSSQATRKRQKGGPVYTANTCKTHWVSFASTPGKAVATLDHEMPADADEFEVIPEAAAAVAHSTKEADIRATARKQRAQAIATLESRLVYVVSSEKYFDTVRHKLINSDAGIKHMFTSSMPLGKNGRMNPVKILENSTTKRSVEGLGFHPGEGAIFQVGNDSFANGYRNRLPTPLEPTRLEREKIEWLFLRIADEQYRTWLKQFFGHIVQRPGVKIKTAPLLWSEIQRNGKTTLLKTIPSLLVGPEFSTDIDYSLLASDFNDYLQGAWHVNLTEFRAGTRGERAMINNKLKAYIADDMIPFHPKGGRGFALPNHFFLTATSNEEDAAAIDTNDERWGVYEMKVPKFTEGERQWIYHQFLLLPRAAAVLRHYFLHVDLEGFSAAGSAPMTASKEEMVRASASSDVEMLQLMFEERAEFFSRDVVITSEVMSYIHRNSHNKPSANKLGKILARAPFNGQPIQFRAGAGRYRGMVIRNHAQWLSAPGKMVMDHIRGEDESIEIDLMS